MFLFFLLCKALVYGGCNASCSFSSLWQSIIQQIHGDLDQRNKSKFQHFFRPLKSSGIMETSNKSLAASSQYKQPIETRKLKLQIPSSTYHSRDTKGDRDGSLGPDSEIAVANICVEFMEKKEWSHGFHHWIQSPVCFFADKPFVLRCFQQ